MLSQKQAKLWVSVVVGWGDEFHVADGSLSGRMVEGLVDLARVTGLENALPWSCQSGQSFLYLLDVVPEFFLNVIYSTNSSFPLISHIP